MPEQGGLEKLAIFLQGHGIGILIILVTGIGYSLVGIFAEKGIEPGIWATLVTTVALDVILVCLHIRKEKTIRMLEIRLEERGEELLRAGNRYSELEDRFSVVSGHLRTLSDLVVFGLSKKLGYGNDHRVSIYRHDGDKFFKIARFSENPRFNGDGRPMYSDTEGFIGLGWSHSRYYVDNLPDPNTAEKTYINEIKKKCEIDEGVIKALTMKSRSYFVTCLRTLEGFNSTGVIVFESILPSGIDFEKAELEIESFKSEIDILVESRKSMKLTREIGI